MSAWTIPQLLEATDGQLVHGRAQGPVAGVSIDSRGLKPGEAYVAILGRRFDGHAFIKDAAQAGAACVIASQPPHLTNGCRAVPVILVEDTTEALGCLARFHRRRLGRPVVAITGSCGKTTTKDLIAHLLGDPGAVLKSQGSQNNHIGVPLTLLRLAAEHQMAVVELGSNHPGEIAYLASIAEPNVAVITNIGPAHLEFFGSLMEVMREKLSLCEAIPPDGAAVIPGDQLDVCLEVPRRLDPNARVVSFGTADRCDIQALDIQRAPDGMRVQLRDRLESWTVPLIGYHNVENALAAVACAWALGVPLSQVRERLGTFTAVPMRSEVLHGHGITILNDCYNANPLSVARALEALRDLPVRRRVAIMGDMLELGDFAVSAHQAIGRLASQLGIEAVLAVGDYAEDIARGVRELRSDGVRTYRTVPELLQHLPGLLEPGDGLLVKGSRKLSLEQVTEYVLRHLRAVHESGAG